MNRYVALEFDGHVICTYPCDIVPDVGDTVRIQPYTDPFVAVGKEFEFKYDAVFVTIRLEKGLSVIQGTVPPELKASGHASITVSP